MGHIVSKITRKKCASDAIWPLKAIKRHRRHDTRPKLNETVTREGWIEIRLFTRGRQAQGATGLPMQEPGHEGTSVPHYGILIVERQVTGFPVLAPRLGIRREDQVDI